MKFREVIKENKRIDESATAEIIQGLVGSGIGLSLGSVVMTGVLAKLYDLPIGKTYKSVFGSLVPKGIKNLFKSDEQKAMEKITKKIIKNKNIMDDIERLETVMDFKGMSGNDNNRKANIRIKELNNSIEKEIHKSFSEDEIKTVMSVMDNIKGSDRYDYD